MIRKNVVSSNIASIWYDKENEYLEIEFIDWSLYAYEFVPEFIFLEFISSDSHWKYFHANIKWVYSYYKLT